MKTVLNYILRGVILSAIVFVFVTILVLVFFIPIMFLLGVRESQDFLELLIFSVCIAWILSVTAFLLSFFILE